MLTTKNHPESWPAAGVPVAPGPAPALLLSMAGRAQRSYPRSMTTELTLPSTSQRLVQMMVLVMARRYMAVSNPIMVICKIQTTIIFERFSTNQ
jgi:hypothetical protein